MLPLCHHGPRKDGGSKVNQTVNLLATWSHVFLLLFTVLTIYKNEAIVSVTSFSLNVSHWHINAWKVFYSFTLWYCGRDSPSPPSR